MSDLALELVDGPRAAAYGAPEDNLQRIGQTWAGVLGCEPIPAWRVALCLAALKIARAGFQPADDSLVDAVGYLEIARRTRG